MSIRRSHKAFTMPELMVSAAIMAYALSVIVLSFFRNYALNETSRNLTVATSHLNYVLEDIRNTTFSSISTNISGGNWNWNSSTITSKGLTTLNSESITTTSSGTTLLTVTVTASWKDLQSRTQTKSLQTQMSS